MGQLLSYLEKDKIRTLEKTFTMYVTGKRTSIPKFFFQIEEENSYQNPNGKMRKRHRFLKRYKNGPLRIDVKAYS